MKKNQRHLVAITIVAAALCADRAIAAAPNLATPVSNATRAFGQRLTGSLRRTISTVRLQEVRREGEIAAPSMTQIPESAPLIHTSEGTPFRFRLPPPAL